MIRQLPFSYWPLALIVATSAPAVGVSAASPSLPSPQAESASAVNAAILEAAVRFGVPASWVRAVIQVESRGNTSAISSKGAMGLMQVMPATYGELKRRLGLGANPFAVRDNVMAGTAYLRDMLDRYGVVGMMGAYNAGPVRWTQHLAGARPLPQETIDYIDALAPLLGPELINGAVPTAFVRPEATAEAPIFVSQPSPSPAQRSASDQQRLVEVIADNPTLVPGQTAASTRSLAHRQRRQDGRTHTITARAQFHVDPTGTALFVAPTSPGDGP